MGLDMGLVGCVGSNETELAYWRKANAIHNYFVEVVQNDNDDCGSYVVSESDLNTLAEACKDVLANLNLAESVLPTVGGFFFGSIEYDEGYMDDLKDTLVAVETALKFMQDNPNGEVRYWSSW